MALRCSASRRASARLRHTMYRRSPILTCLASSSVSSPETRGTTQRDKGRLIINHGAAHLGTAALAHAEDVFELAFLQRGNALGADHAAVGDDADAADAKTSAQPVDDRQQGGDIGGVAGPQLAAQRPAVLIHDQPDDHLMEIRAVVFRMAATTKLLAAPSLEGQAGGVHEDDAEFGEQVAPTGKQPLFHEVLAAARRQLAGSGLIGERLAEPSHGAVEMMQLKGLSALDPVVGSPLFRSAVRARHKQPVEHRQEYRALGSKLDLPACGQLF